VFFEQLNYQIENVIIYKEYALRYSYATDASKYFTVITDFDDTKRQVSKNTIPVFKFNNKYTVFKYHLESSIDPEKVLNVFKNCGGRLTDGGEWEFTSINLLTEKFKTKTLTCPNSEQTPHGYRIFNLQPREGVFYNDTDKEIRALVKQKNNIHQIPHFSIFGPSLLVNYKNQKPLVFDGLISIMMGKESNYFELFDDMTCDFTEHLSVINHAAIYCDIIESQLFGDVSAPVLQVINLHSSTTADTVTFFDNPAYLNVNKTLINSINIRVVDLQGDPIRFDNIFSFIIIKLHFRKKI
jgi:hypothetical protein